MIAGHFTSGALRTSILFWGVTIDKNRHNDGRHRVLADICKQWAAYGYIMSGVTDVVPYDCQKRGISYKKLKAVAVTK